MEVLYPWGGTVETKRTVQIQMLSVTCRWSGKVLYFPALHHSDQTHAWLLLDPVNWSWALETSCIDGCAEAV